MVKLDVNKFRHLTRKQSKKSGHLPGSLIYVGDRVAQPTSISLIDYTDTEFQERTIEDITECLPFKDKPSVTWLNIDGLADTEIMRRLGESFDLHPLVLEDVLNTNQRPKQEDYGNYVYMVLKMLFRPTGSNEVAYEQISIVLGQNWVMSFQERAGDVFQNIRDRIRNNKGRIRRSGADYLAYSLIDSIVDHYYEILEMFGEQIESIEERLTSNPEPEILRDIYGLKREIIFLRKSVWPLRELVGALMRGESSLISPGTNTYLRDVYDHTVQVMDTVETYADVLSGLLDVYMSSISNRMNEVMKTLTIIATIFIPLTFIVGLYGMNFKYMPELDSAYGYPAVLVMMLIISLVEVYYFKRKGWI